MCAAVRSLRLDKVLVEVCSASGVRSVELQAEGTHLYVFSRHRP